MARAGLVMALAVLVCGCARWMPARLGEVPVGSDVRLHLSEEGVRELEELTGTRRSEVFGELLQWNEEVMVSAALGTGGVGAAGSGLRQRIVVEEDNIVGVEIRELDRTLTWIFAGSVAVVGGAAIVWTVSKLIGGGTAATTQPPDPGSSEPFVRFP